MRENELKNNKTEENEKIRRPVWIAFCVVAAITLVLIFVGIKDPDAVKSIRDLTITLAIFILFVLGAAVAVLSFFLSSKIETARGQIDETLSQADGKVEELADRVTDLLKSILSPFVHFSSNRAGISNVISERKEE